MMRIIMAAALALTAKAASAAQPIWDAKMGSADVLEALYPLLVKHGKPAYLRSDNEPGFAAAPFQDWLRRFGIAPIRVYPGSPWSAAGKHG